MSDPANVQQSGGLPVPHTINFFMGPPPSTASAPTTNSGSGNPATAGSTPVIKPDHKEIKSKPAISPIVGGFNAAAKTVTWSADFSSYIGDLDVRDWQPEHTQAWLSDMFSGAEQLATYDVHFLFAQLKSFFRYLADFKRIGVKGVDLLTMNDPDVFKEFGITNPIHVNRIISGHAQLVAHQERCDEKKAAQVALEQSEKTYFEIKKKYEKLMTLTNPSYSLPTNIMSWKPEDVYAFLMLPQNFEQLQMFVRPLALSNVGGEKLLELSREEAIVSWYAFAVIICDLLCTSLNEENCWIPGPTNCVILPLQLQDH